MGSCEEIPEPQTTSPDTQSKLIAWMDRICNLFAPSVILTWEHCSGQTYWLRVGEVSIATASSALEWDKFEAAVRRWLSNNREYVA